MLAPFDCHYSLNRLPPSLILSLTYGQHTEWQSSLVLESAPSPYAFHPFLTLPAGHEGTTTYGTVQSTSVQQDVSKFYQLLRDILMNLQGSQVVVIKEDRTGAIVNLP